MQYIIMFLIVIGLSLSDVFTGWIKAHVTNDYHSGTMRTGLYRKVSEWMIMLTSVGLEIGLNMLGTYYNAAQLADIAGTVTAVSVFIYITVMEIISIFENFAEIHPEAKWIKPFLKKLRKFSDNQEDDKRRYDQNGN